MRPHVQPGRCVADLPYMTHLYAIAAGEEGVSCWEVRGSLLAVSWHAAGECHYVCRIRWVESSAASVGGSRQAFKEMS